MTANVRGVLIASSVRERPEVLVQFLRAIARVYATCPDSDLLFVDDNDVALSSALLDTFAAERADRAVTIWREDRRRGPYVRDEAGHRWTEHLVHRLARIKDRIIEYAVGRNYSHLFLVDADVLVHPETVQVLCDARVDIVSEVYWTRWRPTEPEMPQVWLSGHYTLYKRQLDEAPRPDEVASRQQQFLEALRRPGLHEVGGLGACTLISRRAMVAGVRFKLLPNVELWGEDRHFCIRAAALGFRLWADTHVPPLHLYRPSLLASVPVWEAEQGDRSRIYRARRLLDRALRRWGSWSPLTWQPAQGLEDFEPAFAEPFLLAARGHEDEVRNGPVTTLALAQVDHVELGPSVVRAYGIAIEREGAVRSALHVLAEINDRAGAAKIHNLEFEPAAPRECVPLVRRTIALHVVGVAAAEADWPWVDEIVRVAVDGEPYWLKAWEIGRTTQADWICLLRMEETLDRDKTDVRAWLEQDQRDVIAVQGSDGELTPVFIRSDPDALPRPIDTELLERTLVVDARIVRRDVGRP